MSDQVKDLLKIAQVLKSNGTDGEVIIGFKDIGPEDINFKEPVFIFFDGLPVPFFIDVVRNRGNSKIIARLTDINSFSDAEEIAGRDIFAYDDKTTSDEDEPEMLVGWTVAASVKGKPSEKIGIITGIMDIPGNTCLEVETKNGTAIIPLHEDLILSADPENKILEMEIPDGLL